MHYYNKLNLEIPANYQQHFAACLWSPLHCNDPCTCCRPFCCRCFLLEPNFDWLKRTKSNSRGSWKRAPPLCWWKKSCTTWHVWNPVNNGGYLPYQLVFTPDFWLPSTVVSPKNFFQKNNTEVQSRFIQEKFLLFIHPQVEIPLGPFQLGIVKLRGFEIPSFEVTFCGVTFANSNIQRCQNRRKTVLLKREARTKSKSIQSNSLEAVLYKPILQHFITHIESMGLVYLPIHEWVIFMGSIYRYIYDRPMDPLLAYPNPYHGSICIFTYMNGLFLIVKYIVNLVGKYTIPLDPKTHETCRFFRPSIYYGS